MDRLRILSIPDPKDNNNDDDDSDYDSDDLDATDSPVHDLLQMLSDLVDVDEPSRINLFTPILTEKHENSEHLTFSQNVSQKYNVGISDKFRDALKEIFTLYASNEDGSMSLRDFRRYVLSVGAGQLSASMDRVSNVFSQFEPDFHESHCLRFDGFCAFYKEACTDRLNYVWSDIFTQQYLPNLERSELSQTNTVSNQPGRGLIRDLIAKHPEYDHVMSNVFAMKHR